MGGGGGNMGRGEYGGRGRNMRGGGGIWEEYDGSKIWSRIWRVEDGEYGEGVEYGGYNMGEQYGG